MIEQKLVRLIAHLIRNEGVEPEAIERAVSSARAMRLGEVTSLTGGEDGPMRRAFCHEQVGLLIRASKGATDGA
jgi:hypothetical protein